MCVYNDISDLASIRIVSRSSDIRERNDISLEIVLRFRS